jgi:predicted AlkP superfamily phosphohydrolase/phosphomutase
MSRPVVVIGFDAMDRRLAGALMDAGRMPTLAGLRRSGTTASLGSPPGLVVGSIWPTIWSGRPPGDHAFYCFRQVQPRTYRIRRYTPRDIPVEPFWMPLARTGRRVCAFDVPLVAPTSPVDGVHIVDWGTHDSILPTAVWPPELRGVLASRVGEHPIGAVRCDSYASRRDWRGLLTALHEGASRRTDLTCALLERADWDCLVTVYSESHCAGHQYWWSHDDRHPRFATRADLGDALEEVYEALDRELARLLAAVPPDATVVVVLSHGIGDHHDGDHLFAEIIRRLDDAYGAPPAWLVARERVMRAVDRVMRTVRRAGRGERATYVDSARRFYRIPNNELYAAIRLNLRGREPRGRVAPGAEAARVLEWIERELLALRDEESGRPLVRRVMRADDLYPGPRRDGLPDLFVDWERTAPITSATSPTIGVVRGSYDGIRSGDHRLGGLVIVRGDPRLLGGRVALEAHELAPLLRTAVEA